MQANFQSSRQLTPSQSLASNAANDNSVYSLHSGQLTVSYAPDVFGGVRRQIEAADAQVDNQIFQKEATELTLTANLANALVQQASFEDQIEVTRRLIEIQDQLLALLKRQQQAGQIALPDVLAQETAVAQAKLLLPPLVRQREQQRHLVAVLAGRFPSELRRRTLKLASFKTPHHVFFRTEDQLPRLASGKVAKHVLAREAADHELAESRRRVSELAQHLQTSVDMERAAIAREIHDDVGGSLTALKFDLAWIARHADTAEVQQRVQAALDLVTHAIEASKRIMHNLHPAILEQGLVAALQWMTSSFEKRTGIACSFRTSHELMVLPAGVPLVAYRTAQEALTNVAKHAQATRVGIDLSLASGVLSLEITDNGRGLSDADLAKARSFGIRGLHERASTVGGWVELSSSAQRGTTLFLSIPLQGSAELVDGDEDPALDDNGGLSSMWGPTT